MVDAMARFGTVSSSALDAYFAILQQGDAILVRSPEGKTMPSSATC